MITLNQNQHKVFKFVCGGVELAKVLKYYGFISDVMQHEQKIVCPFHQDVNPSMKINLETGKFHCFGCELFGNAYDFVKYMCPCMNDLECAVRFIKILNSKKVNMVTIPKRHKTAMQNQEAFDISYDFYYNLPEIDWMADNSDDVKNTRIYMRNRGFDPETLNKCQAKVTYNKFYPIVFPMLDNGEFKGWVCRTMLPEIEKKRKYLYNKGFLRSNTLVGKYKGCNVVFVVEGYMDRLKFVQFGINNVVAILGWKMSHEQETSLKKNGVNIIVSALDNDISGRKGTEYLRKIFPNVVRFCYLKGIKDPGEMTEEMFQKMYKKTLLKIKGG